MSQPALRTTFEWDEYRRILKKMTQRGDTLQSIGDYFGRTKEWARLELHSMGLHASWKKARRKKYSKRAAARRVTSLATNYRGMEMLRFLADCRERGLEVEFAQGRWRLKGWPIRIHCPMRTKVSTPRYPENRYYAAHSHTPRAVRVIVFPGHKHRYFALPNFNKKDQVFYFRDDKLPKYEKWTPLRELKPWVDQHPGRKQMG